MKKALTIILLAGMLITSAPAFAGTHGTNGKDSAKSVASGLTSLLIWPGIGQIINEQNGEKCATHALLGLTGIFRFWSFYDGIADRQGGVWNNRI